MFSKNHLNIDFEEQFKEDDTWRCLLDELWEFASQHADRISEKIKSEGDFAVFCDECEQETVSLNLGSCLLCGHWQNIEDI